jgi:hypothetical protein
MKLVGRLAFELGERLFRKSTVIRIRLLGIPVLAVLAALLGCGSGASHDTILEQKLDQLNAKLTDVEHDRSTRKSEIDLQLVRISSQVEILADGLPQTDSSSTLDVSMLKPGSTSDLAWYLATDNSEERTTLVRRRLDQAAGYKEVTVENVQVIALEIESLTVMLGSPEGLDLSLLQEIEESQARLVTLLQKQIPSIVEDLDAKTVRAPDYSTGLKTWSMSSTVLGYFPSSNNPIEAAKIQQMISSHESARSRLDLIQRQFYNLWACQQIRKAWNDFKEISNPGARMQTCLKFLGPIHTGLLDPVSIELYREFLQEIQKTLGAELYQSLAEKLATIPRKLLSEIEQP